MAVGPAVTRASTAGWWIARLLRPASRTPPQGSDFPGRAAGAARPRRCGSAKRATALPCPGLYRTYDHASGARLGCGVNFFSPSARRWSAGLPGSRSLCCTCRARSRAASGLSPPSSIEVRFLMPVMHVTHLRRYFGNGACLREEADAPRRRRLLERASPDVAQRRQCHRGKQEVLAPDTSARGTQRRPHRLRFRQCAAAR